MAEGFEPYHVPQQSRRDKLRVVAHNHPNDLHGILSLYDTSLLPSDLVVCSTNSNSLSAVGDKPNPVCVVKGEGASMMGFVGGIVNGSSSTSSTTHEQHHPYLDLQSSLPSYPSCSIQDVNCGNPFLYVPQNLQHLRDFDQPFAGAAGSEVVAFKPEPLSLSLSSHNTHQSNLPLELNLQRYGSAIYDDKVTAVYTVPCNIVGGGGLTSNEVSRSSVPLGPFTGYASVLKGSRFLRPAQHLLEELCDVGREIYGEKISVDASLMDPPIECLDATRILEDSLGCGDVGEARRKKSRLISMLDEVYRRYKQYYQQMQAVVASFECVAGLGNAAPYANLALKAMSKHFRSLKNAITDQLQFTNKEHVQPSQEATRFGNSSGRNLYGQRPVHNSGFIEQKPVWRPQRGLPERAVTVLRAWLFEHFLHPYPTDTDKLLLAKQTGLSRSQVSNWFINARVRLWKPMVEEIHMLETRQGQKGSQQDGNNSSDQVPQSTSVVSDNPSTSTQRIQEVPSKRSRNDLLDLPVGSEDAVNLSFHNLAGHPHVGAGTSMANGSSGVSLTLGLHQNKGIGMAESFPINAAQRFGPRLEASDEGYVMGGLTRHYGRGAVGGQLLHDFVG